MKKGIITIGVDKNTTQEEIQEIRQRFKNSKKYKEYKLNIIISGNNNFQQNLTKFLKAKF